MKRSKIRQGIEKEINEKYYYYEGIGLWEDSEHLLT